MCGCGILFLLIESARNIAECSGMVFQDLKLYFLACLPTRLILLMWVNIKVAIPVHQYYIFVTMQSYRLEPLILRHYTTLMPVPIHRFDSRTKEPYDTMAPIASTEEPVKTTPKKCKSSSSLGKVEPEEPGK